VLPRLPPHRHRLPPRLRPLGSRTHVVVAEVREPPAACAARGPPRSGRRHTDRRAARRGRAPPTRGPRRPARGPSHARRGDHPLAGIAAQEPQQRCRHPLLVVTEHRRRCTPPFLEMARRPPERAIEVAEVHAFASAGRALGGHARAVDTMAPDRLSKGRNVVYGMWQFWHRLPSPSLRCGVVGDARADVVVAGRAGPVAVATRSELVIGGGPPCIAWHERHERFPLLGAARLDEAVVTLARRRGSLPSGQKCSSM